MLPRGADPDALVATLSHDNYYKHRPDLSDGERDQINFDHPDSLETELMVHDLKQLLAGKPVECPVYDFATHLRRQDTVLHVEPRPIILVEGILIFTNEDLRNLMNLECMSTWRQIAASCAALSVISSTAAAPSSPLSRST